MTGDEVRRLAKENGVYLWQIAEKMGVNDGNFSRKLRGTLSESDAEKIQNAVQELTQGQPSE